MDRTDSRGRVSVVLPTADRVEFVSGAVESVLRQTYPDVECVVVDGGSTDGTRDYLDSIDDDRLRVVARDRPRGLASARNAGLEAASGEYVVFLDDDDRLVEDAVDVLVRTIRDQSPDCGGVYTARRRAFESGRTDEQRVTDGSVERYVDTSIGGPSGTLVRAAVFDEIGNFDESLPACEDTDLWIRLFSAFRMVGVDRVLYEKRCHEGQMTRDTELLLRGTERLIEKHEDALSDAGFAALSAMAASRYAQLGEPARARSKLRTAIRTYPWRPIDYCVYACLLFGSTGYELGYRGYRTVPGVMDRLRPS